MCEATDAARSLLDRFRDGEHQDDHNKVHQSIKIASALVRPIRSPATMKLSGAVSPFE